MKEKKDPVEMATSTAEVEASVESEPMAEADLMDEIEQLKGAIAGLKAENEERRAAPSIDGGAGRTTVPPITKDALARMKPSEIAELDWADVRKVLAS